MIGAGFLTLHAENAQPVPDAGRGSDASAIAIQDGSMEQSAKKSTEKGQRSVEGC